MNKLQQLTCASVASLAFVEQAFALDVGKNNVHSSIADTNTSASDYVQSIIASGMKFLYLLAVCYALYGGFLMLTAGGSDDNVKKGRKVLIHAMLGIVVIFLAGAIVGWILGLVQQG